jgi:hypothetical protein
VDPISCRTAPHPTLCSHPTPHPSVVASCSIPRRTCSSSLHTAPPLQLAARRAPTATHRVTSTTHAGVLLRCRRRCRSPPEGCGHFDVVAAVTHDLNKEMLR